jgi:hypothetical protein
MSMYITWFSRRLSNLSFDWRPEMNDSWQMDAVNTRQNNITAISIITMCNCRCILDCEYRAAVYGIYNSPEIARKVMTYDITNVALYS